jgi:transposase-like protein
METTVCPACHRHDTKALGFSMTYGVIGSLMLKLAKCNECGVTFDRKTNSTTAPARYRVISTIVVLALVVFFVTLVFMLTSGQFDSAIQHSAR